MSTSAAAAGQACDGHPDWRETAACRDADPELFVPDGTSGLPRAQVKTAKPICRGCLSAPRA